MKKQAGFTLMELMIVIAIFGILAAISIQQYRAYIGRAQLGEALSLLGGVRTQTMEFWTQTGFCPDNSGSANPVSGINPSGSIAKASQISGKYVERVEVNFGGGLVTEAFYCEIKAYMRTNGVNGGADKSLTMLLAKPLANQSNQNTVTRSFCYSEDIDGAYLPRSCMTLQEFADLAGSGGV